MGKTSQVIQGAVNDALQRTFSVAKITRAANAMGKRAVELNIERTLQGYDVNGRKFKKHTKSYTKQKAKIIAGKYKLQGSRTKYAATKLPDFMRLSGQTLSGLGYRVLQAGNFKKGTLATVMLTLSGVAKQRTEWNQRRGRDWFGISQSGRFAKYQRQELDNAYTNGLGVGQAAAITLK